MLQLQRNAGFHRRFPIDGITERLGSIEKVRTPGIEPGTIRYLRNLQSNALPTELCSELISKAARRKSYRNR